MAQKRITFDSFIRGALTGAVIVAVIYLVHLLSGVLLPFMIAWLIAYMAYPLVTFFQYKLRLRSRGLSIFVVMTLLLALLALVVVGIVPPLIDEFGKLRGVLTDYFVEGSKQAAIPGTLANFISEHINMLQVSDALDKDHFAETLSEVWPQIQGLLTHSFNLIISIFTSFIILLYTFFILLDYETISQGWVRLVPVKWRQVAVTLVGDIEEGMNSYFRGQALVALCVGILFSIGFLIIDFPLAIGFGLFIGVLNLVPYLQLVAILPTVLLALLKAADTGQNFWVILLSAGLVFVVVQALQDAVIVPKVMGRITGLNPAIILLSLSVWGSLLGIVGMIIALPCTTLLLSYYRRYIAKKEREYGLQEPSEENPA